jgi:O-antigen ligase
MSFAILVALGVCFGYAVFERGGVGWSEWSLTVLAVGALGCLHFLWTFRPRPAGERNDGEKVPGLDPMAGFSAAAFLCFVALQLVPLPANLVRHLSPKRVELQQAALAFANESSPQASAGFVTLSAVPHVTAEYLLRTSSCVLVFLLIRDLGLRLAKWPWATAVPLIIVVGFEAVLGILQVNGGAPGAFATGTYASRDHYAGLIEMVLPFPVMFAVATLRRDSSPFDSPAVRALPAVSALKASLLLGIAAIMLVAIVLSLSRMGFLAALASLLVAGVAAVSLRAASQRSEAHYLRKWVPTAAVIFIVIFGLFFLPTNSLLARFADISHTSEISPDTRIQIWRDAAGMLKDYPLFGCGMGSFESCFLKYKTVAPMYTVNYAHNDYLQVLAELGLFGFLAGLLFVGRVFQRSVRAIFHSGSAVFHSSPMDGRYLAIACVASMTAILLHSFVDFNVYVPANGMLYAWIAGIAGVHLTRRKRQPQVVA